MTVGLFLTALGLGLRHGIDWDHIAAIADLSASAESRKRGFLLSFLYAAGHGVVVIALGSLAILFGASLPEGVDVWMGRVVGATLVALGAWVLIELVRKGRDFRLRSRWILVLGGTFAGLRRVRQASARRKLRIDHDHEHDHAHDYSHVGNDSDLYTVDHGLAHADDHAHDYSHVGNDSDLYTVDHGLAHADDHAHDHSHIGDDDVIDLTAETPTPAMAEQHADRATIDSDPQRRFSWFGGRGSTGHGLGHAHTHSHSHRHETVLADSVTSSGAGNGTAAGIGLLHGIGFESPTQIAVFVASTSVVGAWAGFGLLVAWVAGLIVANSALAVLAAYGLLGAERNFVIYATVAVLVGLISLAMGVLLLAGIDGVLPALV